MLDLKAPLIAEFLKDHQQFSRLLYEISKLLDENNIEQARARPPMKTSPFAHNGTLAGFDKICGKLEKETRPELQSRRSGQTDSEQYFLWLLSRAQLSTDSGLPADQVTEIAEALRHSVSQLANWCQAAASDEPPRLNFVLTDGESMLACRWNHSLFTIRREGMYECEICGIPHVHHHQTENHRSVAFASEPVTHEKWEEVANQSIVAFNLGIASPTC